MNDDFKLEKEILLERYGKFGGIPRCIFTFTDIENEFDLREAINSYNAMDILHYAEMNQPLKETGLLDMVLQTEPSRSDFSALFDLEFLSRYIAE